MSDVCKLYQVSENTSIDCEETYYITITGEFEHIGIISNEYTSIFFDIHCQWNELVYFPDENKFKLGDENGNTLALSVPFYIIQYPDNTDFNYYEWTNLVELPITTINNIKIGKKSFTDILSLTCGTDKFVSTNLPSVGKTTVTFSDGATATNVDTIDVYDALNNICKYKLTGKSNFCLLKNGKIGIKVNNNFYVFESTHNNSSLEFLYDNDGSVYTIRDNQIPTERIEGFPYDNLYLLGENIAGYSDMVVLTAPASFDESDWEDKYCITTDGEYTMKQIALDGSSCGIYSAVLHPAGTPADSDIMCWFNCVNLVPNNNKFYVHTDALVYKDPFSSSPSQYGGHQENAVVTCFNKLSLRLENANTTITTTSNITLDSRDGQFAYFTVNGNGGTITLS